MRSVGHGELAGIQADQTPRIKEGGGVLIRVSNGLEAGLKEIGKNVPRDAGSAFADGRSGEFFPQQQVKMMAEGTRAFEEVKDQCPDEIGSGNRGAASPRAGKGPENGGESGVGNEGRKVLFEGIG